MESSLLKLHGGLSELAPGERRRRIRHKLHSPAYASFNGPSAGMVFDLNELLDLSEEGFAVQAGKWLEINQVVSFSLDLTETKAHIYGAGRVIWTDGAGRGGIRFSGLTDESQRLLREWLLVNLFVAARNAKLKPAAVIEITSPSAAPTRQLIDRAEAPAPDEVESAIAALRNELTATTGFDAALLLITERALSITHAHGAALAFECEDKMTCHASFGEPTLPLGTEVDVKKGITGECVRSGRTVACEDIESDARVDQEICRALGIGSILAAPIVANFRVVGLIEVFSANPHAFSSTHQMALDRLAELVPQYRPTEVIAPEPAAGVTVPVPTEPASFSVAADPHPEVWEQEQEAQEPLRGVPVRLTHIILLVLTMAAVFLVAGYLSAPRIESMWLRKSLAGAPSTAATKVISTSVTPGMPFDGLRKLAELGDVHAQWILGTRYHNGEGVPQDDAQAMRWFERAADQGYVDAQATAGAYYWAGRGVPKDLTRSYFWSTVALRQGDASMESRLQGLVLQMTTAQVAAAQREADDWLDRHPAKSASN